MRYCPGDKNPHSSIVTLRATCTIHAALECGVTPATWTFRLPRWMEKRTEYVTSPPSVQTSAVKKSVATRTSMCVRINSFHVVVVVPLQGRGKAMALENVAHRLVTHGVSEIGECPHDAVITPRAILLGHADNQGLESW